MTDARDAPAVALYAASRPLAGSGVEEAPPYPAVAIGQKLSRARREWLHTNGAGAYASSTLAGMHTRRYHGLLVAALEPPRARHVLLSHVDVTVTPAPGSTAAGAPHSRPPSRPKWDLAKHQFPGVDPEASPFYLERFDQDPLPRWTHHVAGGVLEVTLALVRGENAVVLRYAFTRGEAAGPASVLLSLRPLHAARSYHHLTREHGGMLQRVELRALENGAGEMRVQPRRELPRVCFRYEGTFVGSPDWWRRFEYLAERDRGLDFEEDLWTPGLFEVPLDADGTPRHLVAAVDKLPHGEPAALLEATRAALLAEDPGPRLPRAARRLTLSAEVFRADLALHPGVIAGYPWFEVWGRDTLIALPGLYLVPGKIDAALRVLHGMIDAMQDGLVPNRVPDSGDGTDHCSADATLWLFEAARHVADILGDRHPFITDELLLALHDAFEAALRGTREGIHVTPEGLYAAGHDGGARERSQDGGPREPPQTPPDHAHAHAAHGAHAGGLTWMDARVNGHPVTPRTGCPVELTALWARGCDTLARLAHAAGDAPLAARAEAERDRARRAFADRFWCAATGYPYDVISPEPTGPTAFHDASVRPNAVLALAVDPACFTPDQADAVLARARRDLLTPAGLRTLAPGEAGYTGRYAGSVPARDGAYHQGTVWPWLLGAYVRAALRRGEDRAELTQLVTSAAGNSLALGHVPELADGDAPHAPAGCFAQAWSVAELLRALVWDLGGEGVGADAEGRLASTPAPRTVTWRTRLRSRRLRRVLLALAALVLAPVFALVVAAALTPLPPELAGARAPSTGTVLRDRHGVVLRELHADDGVRGRWLPLDEAGERLQRAVLAAEDHRFAHHPGVDPLAIARAFGQMIFHRRIVSGASTLTQQLARNLVHRPRTLRGKFMEAALALRIEHSLDKRAILEQYLNRVSFGPGLRGVEAASRFYFDKPPRDLSLAEAAALAGIPRGPTLYDPTKGTARLKRRRDRILERLLDTGLATRDDVARALAEPLAVAATAGSLGAPHLVRAVMSGTLDKAAGPLRDRTTEITLTLDRRLQRELEVLALSAVRSLSTRKATAASLVALDNATGDVLAYVGSPDLDDAAHLGQNDGVLALRQPGSALKPFVYELALERLGFTAATVLPDVELSLPTRDGDYRPNNYDGRFHGPVRLREALANSYNVPAVWTADALGPPLVLARLGEVGLTSLLAEDADHYGAAIALGDGEVRLVDLADAYATLARGGVWRPVRAVKAAVGKDGQALDLAAGRAEDRRVMAEGAAAVITDVLADKEARIASFGEGNVLELPFPAAVKTGTSKGFRDNWAVGYTPEVTVAVWVGNFDGSPMAGVSGVSGAGPLFHDALVAAMRGREARAFVWPEGKVEEAEVCSLSGARPGEACPHRRREPFAVTGGKSTVPEAVCAMHEKVRVDKRNGLRAGPGCAADVVEERVVERFDAMFARWAKEAGRGAAAETWSPLCPGVGSAVAVGTGRVRVAFPVEGARFSIDPGAAGRQGIRIRVDVPSGVAEVRVVIDGVARVVRAPFEVAWTLVAGAHRVRVEAEGVGSDEVGFSVE